MTQAAFSAAWLRLREPFDLTARAVADAQPQMAAHLARWRATQADPTLQVLDLACGLGANLRALAPRLGGAQRWHLIDHDPRLLAALPSALACWSRQQGYRFSADGPGCRIEGPAFSTVVSHEKLDLARSADSLQITPAALITASALLDLVSGAWLQPLVRRARQANAAMYWALSVDGRTYWEPADTGDTAVQALFGLHQQRDKGFGPALGPQAPATALAQIAEAGYRSTTAHSDWDITGEQAAPMRRAMIDSLAAAALEQDPSAAARILAWQARRSAGVARSRLQIGHLDILATLP
jgi:hypothetical protein